MSIDNLASLIDCTITIGVGLLFTLGRSRIVAKIADPKKKEKTDHLLLWAGPIVIAIGMLNAVFRISDLEDPATRAAQMINRAAGKMVDATTRFDRATPGPGLRVVIDETITTVTAAQISMSKWDEYVPVLRKNISNSPEVGKLQAQGITLIYRYHGKDGGLIGEVVFAPPSKAP